MTELYFKQWFEGGGGFIGQSMTDPVNDHPPAGSEITTDPFYRSSDFPPTKNIKKRKLRKFKVAKFGFDANDGGDKVAIRKEVLPNYFV
jgi:hypothetical protein